MLLSNETWKNIFNNLTELEPEDYYDGYVSWVEIVYLDSTEGTEEWALCFGEELFEDGFATEKEAYDRLAYLEDLLL